MMVSMFAGFRRAAIALAFGCAVVIPTASVAYVSNGHEYKLTCNANGYVLTSVYPVARIVGSGVSSKIVSGIERLYLGKSCDAFNETFRSGSWCWANGGFEVNFEGMSFGFGRQELHCGADDDLGLECGC